MGTHVSLSVASEFRFSTQNPHEPSWEGPENHSKPSQLHAQPVSSSSPLLKAPSPLLPDPSAPTCATPCTMCHTVRPPRRWHATAMEAVLMSMPGIFVQSDVSARRVLKFSSSASAVRAQVFSSSAARNERQPRVYQIGSPRSPPCCRFWAVPILPPKPLPSSDAPVNPLRQV